VPFSAGVNKCGGARFATLVEPLLVARLLREFDLELLDPMPQADYANAMPVEAPNPNTQRLACKRRAKHG
jgi:cytochrome P450